MQCSPLRTSTRCSMTSANVESRGGQSSNWPARRLSPTTSETDLNWSKNLVLVKTFSRQTEAFPTNYDNPLVIENGDERPDIFMSHARWQGLQGTGNPGVDLKIKKVGIQLRGEDLKVTDVDKRCYLFARQHVLSAGVIVPPWRRIGFYRCVCSSIGISSSESCDFGRHLLFTQNTRNGLNKHFSGWGTSPKCDTEWRT